MGYYMDQRNAKFKISADKVPAALAAIKELAKDTKRMGGGSSTGERWFAWVTTADFVNAKDIVEAMDAWRWQVEVDDEGNVVDICFNGEKLGDDTILLEAIAPFVEAGSFIEMKGEDDAFWKWVFDGRGMVEVAGKVVYGD